jgi:hypothetical protein
LTQDSRNENPQPSARDDAQSGKAAMNRILDFVNIAMWLLGLGYIVLWPISLFENDAPFAAALVCSISPLALLCFLPDPLTLAPGLQLIGVLSAAWVCVRLVSRAIAHLRRMRAYRAGAVSALITSGTAAFLRPHRHNTIQPLRSVKPRNQFGLRGTPH